MSSVFDPLSSGTTYVDPRQTTQGIDWATFANNALGGFFQLKTAQAQANAPYANGQVPQTRTYAGTLPTDMTPFILIGGFGLAAILLLRR